jgi:hypothetical protein
MMKLVTFVIKLVICDDFLNQPSSFVMTLIHDKVCNLCDKISDL